MRPWFLSWGMALTLVWACAPHGHAQSSGCPSSKGLDPVAFETVTVSTTPIGLTAATITTTTAAAAFLSIEGQPLRYTLVGTPSATVGHLVEPPPAGNADGTKGSWVCGRAALLGLRMIRTAGTDSTVRATLYRAR